MSKNDYRKVMGERLRAFRESRGLSACQVAKKGGIRVDQVRWVEEGNRNYTIDAFLGYVTGCNLYMYFAAKDNPGESTDFEELIQKGIDANPFQESKE